MCGLLGWQFKPGKVSNYQKAVVFASLATSMDTRGGHSWGYYADGLLCRGVGPMAKSCKAQSMVDDNLIGHTRFATTGKVVTENAHPFRFTSMIGAHNGIVYNHSELNFRHQRDCAVDSMHLFLHLEENKPLDDIEAYGAIAFAYLDQPKVFYLSHFNDGELCLLFGKWGCLWASTKWAATSAAKLAGLRYQVRFTRDGELFRLHAGQIFPVDYPINPAKRENPYSWYSKHEPSCAKEYDWDKKWDKLYDEENGLLEESYNGKILDAPETELEDEDPCSFYRGK